MAIYETIAQITALLTNEANSAVTLLDDAELQLAGAKAELAATRRDLEDTKAAIEVAKLGPTPQQLATVARINAECDATCAQIAVFQKQIAAAEAEREKLDEKIKERQAQHAYVTAGFKELRERYA
jgi:chromosome segregation ATPase